MFHNSSLVYRGDGLPLLDDESPSALALVLVDVARLRGGGAEAERELHRRLRVGEAVAELAVGDAVAVRVLNRERENVPSTQRDFVTETI